MSRPSDDLIGKIYDSATNPGDWFSLVEAISQWTQPQVTEDGQEIYHSPELIGSIITHLERAARNNDYIHVLEDQRFTLNHIYNNMPWPLLMVDAQMQVLDANEAAKELLHSSNSISLSSKGVLSFHDKDLKAALMRVLSMEMGRDTQVLSSKNNEYSLLCTPLSKSDAPGAISRLRAVVWIVSNTNKIIPSPEIIQSVFGLTLAEARLLNLLCKEGALNKCAEQLQVSIHTVRSQLKSILSKTNMSSQVQLVSHTMGQSFLQSASKQALSIQGQEQRVVLPDGRVLSWFEYGKSTGRVVLSLEGLSGGMPQHILHDDWYKQKNLRVINIIRPGYGTSTQKENIQFVDLANDIKFLCMHLNLYKPVMAAYCCGSAYALCTAATYTDLFERIGVLGCTVEVKYWDLQHLDSMHKLFLRLYRTSPMIFSIFMRIALRGLQRDPEKSYNNLIKAFHGRDAEVLRDPVYRQHSLKKMREHSYQGIEIIIQEYKLLQNSWNVDLSAIKIPILMWHGEDDPTISIGSARKMAEHLPGVKFKSIPNQGRLIVHDTWRDFLSELLQ